MAAEVEERSFLSAFLDAFFDSLVSHEVANLIQGKKLDPELLRRLGTTLNVVRAVLNDAEQKQIRHPAVKKWLDDLKDAVYVADDLLDEVSTKAVTQKEKEVSGLLSRFLNLPDRELVNKLEDITRRLEYIVKDKDILGLKEIPGENMPWRTPATSLEEGSVIYGRDEDKEAVLKLLLDDETESDGKISVVSIVGIGGVGKTTLAQLVYNDDNLKEEFEFKAWACVSEEFDILKVARTITEAVTRNTCNMNDLNLLQLNLKDMLTEKKFLIVLDDMWSEDYVYWNEMIKPFCYGRKGSKILVTTRSKKVASVVQPSQTYNLTGLSHEDCWSVFANHACISSKSCESTTLDKIGRDIIKRCKGLPLAAKSLGCLLRTNHDFREWNNILKSEIWELSENENKIISILRMSYHNLPSHLKPCFAYCSLFLKDYEFNRDELILLWMVEGFLQPTKKEKTLEEVGYKYFYELLSRSFFQCSTTRSNYFVKHDLVRDLATSVAREFFWTSKEVGKATFINIESPHLSDNIFSHLMVEWIHLLYLNLSRTSIETLPESLCNLYNLETLKLCRCDLLSMLPSGMQNLLNLRHLDTRGTFLQEMPRGMGKLNRLQFLGEFVVGKHEENGIMELGKLSHLHGSLCISKLENVSNSGEALEARMMDKKHINELYLEWSSSTNSQTEGDILDKLQPHRDLKELTIGCYTGTIFPDWVGDSSYNNMTLLRLYSCRNCCMLPSLGQLPSLKYLEVKNLKRLKTIGSEFYKNDYASLVTPFPSLEYLQFHHLSCWQVWRSFESDAFPQLKQLSIINCPKLTRDLPNHLPALETLVIERCEQLTSSLPIAPAISELKIYGSDEVALQRLPLSLDSLSIGGTQVVESMFEAITNTQPTCLQSLSIWGCLSSISFPGGCIPASIKRLEIWDCRKLEFPKKQLSESLESMSISGSCDSLTSFPLEIFPNLNNIEIRNCESLQSLSVSQDAVLQNLQTFTINGLSNLVSFPSEGLAAPNMTSLCVLRCDRLKSLPCHMSTLLPNLEHLEINNCPEIESFPEGGLPHNLRSFRITNCEKLLCVLASMVSLTDLMICGPCDSVKSFPKEGLLPPSLTSLQLHGLSSLEPLDCKGLLCLTSLQQLSIADCPKLENMVGGRLPASLIQLFIHGTPLLEERIRMKHYEIWPRIFHIGHIQVS